MACRNDGYWEVLATAAGDEESVAKSINGLTASVLADGYAGEAVSHSIVQLRVEALAAWRPELLVKVAAGWTRPSALSDDDMDSERDLLIAAWRTATRHLVEHDAVSDQDLRSDVPAIRGAVIASLGRPRDAPTTWNELVAWLAGTDTQYKWEEVRALDRVDIRGPLIDAGMLRDLITRPAADVGARTTTAVHLDRLRVLRHRRGRLTDDAIRYLVEVTREAASTAETSHHELAIVAELAISVRPEIRDELAAVAVTALKTTARPASLAWLCYVLIDCGWRTP